MVDLVSQLEEAAVISGHSRVRQGKLRSRRTVGLLRVVPDHQPFLFDLLGDQLHEIFSHNGHYFTSPFWRSCLPMEDHSYFPAPSSSQHPLAGFHDTSSWR